MNYCSNWCRRHIDETVRILGYTIAVLMLEPTVAPEVFGSLPILHEYQEA
jgi:hypothetical protein